MPTNDTTETPTLPEVLRGALESQSPGQQIQFIGGDPTSMGNSDFELREMTLNDIEDDCPLCQANRDLILAGKPPMAYFQKPAA